jgi:hypothetical protein
MAEPGHYRDIAAAQLRMDDDETQTGSAQPSHMDRVKDNKLVTAISDSAKEKEREAETI